MKLKSVLLLAVAMSCGLVAMLGVQQVLSGDKGDVKVDTVPVLVATTEIAPGIPLGEMNVAFKDWPKSTVPEGAVTKKEEYEERALKIRAVPGDIIMLAKLGPKGAFGASTEIPLGMRVMSVAVDLTMTHSGLILPGNHVDVLVSYSAHVPGRGRVYKIKTVLEGIEVFATDHIRDTVNADQPDVKAKNISLLVTPEQGAALMLAESQGKLHLALRPEGEETDPNRTINPETLFELEQNQQLAGQPEDATPPAPSSEGGPNDLNAFLDKQAQAAGQTNDLNAAIAPIKPKWRIEIFSGSERRIEEVDIPEPEETIPEADSVQSAAAASPPWLGALGRFFTSAGDDRQPEPVNH